MQNRRPPPGFLANKTEDTAGDLLERIKPLCNSSVNVFLRTHSCASFMLNALAALGVLPGCKRISQSSSGRWEGSLSDSALLNSERCLCRYWGRTVAGSRSLSCLSSLAMVLLIFSIVILWSSVFCVWLKLSEFVSGSSALHCAGVSSMIVSELYEVVRSGTFSPSASQISSSEAYDISMLSSFDRAMNCSVSTRRILPALTGTAGAVQEWEVGVVFGECMWAWSDSRQWCLQNLELNSTVWVVVQSGLG